MLASGGAPNAVGPFGTGGSPSTGGIAASGGAGSAGGAGSGGSVADSGGPAECERSAVKDSQVVFIGDSFLAAPTSAIAPELQALWQAEGSPGYSASPRYHQLVGTNMDQIAGQYEAARSANPEIKVVIANGGGNDVLILDRTCLTQGPPTNTGCKKTIDDALAIADTLVGKMERDGVEHVIFFFYPHEPTQGLYQGTAPAINVSLDYAEPLARKACESHLICHFVSLREATGDPIGSGYTDRGYINPNDVHPSPAGSKFFASVLWNEMKKNCVLHP
jgi:lysophospholipase L1-like esterase